MTDQTTNPLTPEIVNAIVRDMDDPCYPSRITVYCDRYGCETERTGEFMVSADMDSEERLAVARKHLVDNEGWEHTDDGDDFCPEHASPAAEEQQTAAREEHPPRSTTPARTNDDGSTTITMQRACNGCGQHLGDVTDAEVERAIAGLPPLDVRSECEHCRPLVELEAEGCTTWQVTRRSYALIASLLDRDGVFTKGYWETVDGELQIVGLRVGTGEGRAVARYGDWLVRHPDAKFTVHKAPAAVETGE